MLRFTLFLTLSAAFCSASQAGAENITFPEGSGVLNVRDAKYGAVGDGKADDTAAIQKALAEGLYKRKIVYLPNGIYRVFDTLKWNNGDPKSKIGGWGPFLQMQGQSRSGTVIKLAEGAPEFGDLAKPKAVVQTGSSGSHGNKKYSNGEGNEAFENHIRNLTIDVGERNVGAVGIDYQASNVAAMRHVTIKGNGFCGLNLTRRDNGPGLIKAVSVEGFRFGVRARQEIAQFVLEDVTLRDQSEAAIWAEGAVLAVRQLQTRGSVPAVKLSGQALLTLLDSTLAGKTGAAIETDGKAAIYLKNVQTTGFSPAMKHGATTFADAKITEWLSSQPLGTADEKTLSLGLPVRETPEFSDENPANWAVVDAPNGKDDTQAIQAAFNAGKSTVFFRSGTYRIGDTISVPASVKLVTGAGTGLNTAGNKILPDDKPFFRLESAKTGDVTIFDRLTISAKNGWFIEHRDARTLVLRDLLPFGARLYRNQSGAGPLFVENVAGDDYRLEPGTQMWARQLNFEGFAGVNVVNNGAKVWALGWKHEGDGTLVRGTNNSQSELLGGLIYTFGIKPESAAFVNTDSALALSFVGTSYVAKNGFFNVLVRDTRGQNTLELARKDVTGRGRGVLVPLFVTSASGARNAHLTTPPPPPAPVVEVQAPQITPAGTTFSPPRAMKGGAPGESAGNPVEIGGNAMWRFDQIWPDDILKVENYRPLTWGGKAWRAKEHSFGGQPEGRVVEGRVILNARSAWKDQPGQKLVAWTFVAPEAGRYDLRVNAALWKWNGGGSVKLVAVKLDRARGVASEIASWELPGDKEKQFPLDASATLEAGQEIALVPQIKNSHTGVQITLSNLRWTRASE